MPKGNPAGITSVYDLTRSGIKLVVANSRVPVGSYTRTVLRNLGISSALRNVVSQESDVKEVVGKVVLGQADAGFVYVTDARVAASQLKSIAIPVFAQPKVRYEIAVVKGSSNLAEARDFVSEGDRRARPEAHGRGRLPLPAKPKPKPKSSR